MQILFVNEVFVSLQGEGHFTGTPAIFVRLQGCDVHCPWCDTGYAMSLARDLRTKDNDFSVLAKETASGLYTSMDPEILCNYLSGLHKSIRHVVLTGGEPFMQDVAPFIRLLQGRGFYVQVEYHTNRGRIDLVLKTDDYIYLMEFKLDGSADQALRQIKDNGYAEAFSSDTRKMFIVGVNFSNELRNIEQWKIISR